MSGASRPIRVLVAKPGLDGHDTGAKLVCRALMDAGMEVVYTGLRQTPAAIAKAALEEDADVVGLSILSSAHIPLSARVAEALAAAGLADRPLVVGGNFPASDHAALRAAGVADVFPTGTRFETIVERIRARARR